MPDVKVAISDPVSADIQAVCSAVESVMNFLATPEGQITVRTWRESSVAFNGAVQQAGRWIENLFTGKLA